MALTFDPNFPPSVLPGYPYSISRDWCIGDSLIVINNNFANLDSRILGLSGNFPLKVNNIDNKAIEKAKLADSAALSVIGRPQNSLGVPSDIVADTDGHVLRRNGTSIGFGQIGTLGIAAKAVTGGGTTGNIAEKTITAYNIADGTITNDKVSATATARIAGTKITSNFGNQDIITTGRVAINSSTPQGGLYILDKQVRFTDSNKLPGTTYPPAGESNGFNAVIQGNGIDDGGMLIIVGDNNQDEKAIDVWNIGLPSSGSSTNSVGGPSRKFMVQSGGQLYAAGDATFNSDINTNGRIAIGAGTDYRGGFYLLNRTTTYRSPASTQGGAVNQLDGYPSNADTSNKTIAATIRTTGSDSGGLLIIIGDDNGDESALDIWNRSTPIRGLKFRCRSNGAVSCFGVSNLSDRNKKTEIEDTKINGIDFINRFRVVDYLWKDTAETDKNKNIGLIAQEVEPLYPASIAIESGDYHMDYTKFVGPLIKATQELSQLVKEQQKIIEDQQNTIKHLTEKVSTIESKLV